MTVINQMKLEIQSRSVNESFARAAVAAFIAQMDPNLEELGDIKTAISEAVTNCIVHAYPDSLGKIFISAKIFEGGFFEIVIKDKGIGIPNIDQARKPMFTTGGEERSGMGFTIMESFMDKIQVRSKLNGGTTVTMRRRIMPRLSR